MPLLAYLAARTTTIRLGAGTIIAPFWNPIRVAGECALLDVIGYWDNLMKLMETAAAAGFVPERHLELILIDADVDALLDRMAAFIPLGSIAPVPGLPDGPPLHRDLELDGLRGDDVIGTEPRQLKP